ncbi:MAG TPA: hypothetical protein VGO06_14565 [Bosea sp. (in: a-proteobacteria)]|jgi:hypothetical protein|uniref:hypothetical protein n=1 Tax=Bosea sp. (in: a-proteobacteria) TaxID=1871050 RepID=UPI002E13DFEC|nr:hypothetical protein [Bosea sp. (in: a-proteobacteria)]
MTTIAAAGAALLLAGAANAQTRPADPPASAPPATAPQTPSTAPTIKSINVVELDALPEATRAQVNQVVATRTANELQQLQKAIEAAPAVKSAIEAKGFSTRDVVMAEVNDEGELTVVTRRLG